MKMLSPKVWLHYQAIKEPGFNPHLIAHRFVIHRTLNCTTYLPGQVLTRPQVDKMIEMEGIAVEVAGKKGGRRGR